MSAPELSPEERATVDRFEAAPAAPESFDATAALRRIVKVAGDLNALSVSAGPAGQVAYAYAALLVSRAVEGPRC